MKLDRCEKHNHYPSRKYNEKHDSYYCSICNRWLEDTCKDPYCIPCVTRPNLPSQVNLS